MTQSILAIHVTDALLIFMAQLVLFFAMLLLLATTMVFATLLAVAFVIQITLVLSVLNSVPILQLVILEDFVTLMVTVLVILDFLVVHVQDVLMIIINSLHANTALLLCVPIVVFVRVQETVSVPLGTLAYNVESFVMRLRLVMEEASVILQVESVFVDLDSKERIVQVKF